MVKASSKADFSNIFIKEPPKKAESLLKLLDEFIYTKYAEKELQEEMYDGSLAGFHPSQLGMAHCIRKLYNQYHNIPFDTDKKNFTAQTHRIFHNGHAVHDRIQGYLGDIGGYSNDRALLLGRWICKKCGAKYGYDPDPKVTITFPGITCGLLERPTVCACGARGRAFKYNEVTVEHKILKVRGKMDGVLKWKDEYWIVEIKSINPFDFNSMTAPKVEYEAQINFYHEMSGINKALWIYEDKGTQRWREYISFADKKLIASQLKMLVEVNKYIDAKKVPPVYSKPEDEKKYCKYCEYRASSCFPPQ